MFLCPKIYKLLSAVGLDLPYPIHAVWVIVNEWHNQPHFTLLPPLQHHRPPTLPPTHYYLARHWCCGAINLVWRKSKIREKTDLGAWGRDKPSRETGEDCLAISPRSERSGKRPTIEGKRVNESGWVACSTCLQWKQVYATLPYPTTFTPPPPPHTHTTHRPFSSSLISFWRHH